MPDPLSIVSSTVSLVGVIEIVSKSVLALCDIRLQWKDADLTLLHLTSQLTALNSALIQIKEWMDNDCDDIHHTLVIGLESTLKCCDILASKLYDELSTLQTSDRSLDTTAKAKLIFNGGSAKQASKMIQAQTNALQLLLTACNCKMLSSQRGVLRKSAAQKTLDRVHQDSASLIAHRDSTSLLSGHTDNLSKLSMAFDFDRKLFGTKVYAPIVRIALRNSHRLRPPHPVHQMTKNSKPTDGSMRLIPEEDSQPRAVARTRDENSIIKTLVLGVGQGSKSTFVKQLQMIYTNDFTVNERKRWRARIFDHLYHGLKAILELLKERNVVLNSFHEELADYFGKVGAELYPDDCLPESCKNLYKELAMDDQVALAILRECHVTYFENLDYFVRHLDRLFRSKYIPTNEDIVRVRCKTTGVHENVFKAGQGLYSVYDVGGARSERKKWGSISDNVDVLLLLVPLSGYDRPLCENQDDNEMRESLILFESVWNSACFNNSWKILVFTKTDLFQTKIGSGASPLRDYFLDYGSDSTDTTAATEFIRRKFQDLCSKDEELLVRYVDATDIDDVRNVWNFVDSLTTGQNAGSRERQHLGPRTSTQRDGEQQRT